MECNLQYCLRWGGQWTHSLLCLSAISLTFFMVWHRPERDCSLLRLFQTAPTFELYWQVSCRLPYSLALCHMSCQLRLTKLPPTFLKDVATLRSFSGTVWDSVVHPLVAVLQLTVTNCRLVAISSWQHIVNWMSVRSIGKQGAGVIEHMTWIGGQFKYSHHNGQMCLGYCLPPQHWYWNPGTLHRKPRTSDQWIWYLTYCKAGRVSTSPLDD